MSVLAEKAKLCAEEMIKRQLIQPYQDVEFGNLILDIFKNGGSCKLLEGKTEIAKKQIVRNKCGKVIGEQG